MWRSTAARGDVFVHRSRLPQGITELIKGEAVRVEVAERPDGKLRAVPLELLRE